MSIYSDLPGTHNLAPTKAFSTIRPSSTTSPISGNFSKRRATAHERAAQDLNFTMKITEISNHRKTISVGRVRPCQGSAKKPTEMRNQFWQPAKKREPKKFCADLEILGLTDIK